MEDGGAGGPDSSRPLHRDKKPWVMEAVPQADAENGSLFPGSNY